MDRSQYLSAIENFKKSLDEYTAGCANAEARSVMMRHIAEIRFTAGDMGYDSYFSEVIQDMERYVDKLYSPRKHLKYRSASGSGVEELRFRISSCIYRLESLPIKVSKGVGS